MGWVELRNQTRVCGCRRRPIIWPWSRKIGWRSVWECPRCTKRWIVAGYSHRYWSEDVDLWRDQ